MRYAVILVKMFVCYNLADDLHWRLKHECDVAEGCQGDRCLSVLPYTCYFMVVLLHLAKIILYKSDNIDDWVEAYKMLLLHMVHEKCSYTIL
jgi:hypothetical protein